MATSGTYNPEQPWQNQIDRNTVQTLLEQWVPDALNQHGFETLWTPKRLIRQLAAGQLQREPVIQILARYPYLQIPPTPETETFADIPDEGSFHDVSRSLYAGRVTAEFTHQLNAVRDQIEAAGDLSKGY